MPLLNILIVDDEANIRKTLTVFMESRGHQVKSVGSFRGALEETSSNLLPYKLWFGIRGLTALLILNLRGIKEAVMPLRSSCSSSSPIWLRSLTPSGHIW